ncbi:LOW QUALITY PROTEIN: hypothetical protein HZS_932 [Henneguya salminicola]|nr:LOW QUALITY PROTEIN: hypothetical protein HZS_932 [Henneguya salminicola]
MDMITKLSFIPKTLYTQMIQKYTLKPLRICGELLNGFFENMKRIVLPMTLNTWQSFFLDGKSKMYFPRSSILFDINTVAFIFTLNIDSSLQYRIQYIKTLTAVNGNQDRFWSYFENTWLKSYEPCLWNTYLLNDEDVAKN